jgi:hypothetical protein
MTDPANTTSSNPALAGRGVLAVRLRRHSHAAGSAAWRRTFLNLTAGAAVLPAASRVVWANYRPLIQEVIGFIEAQMR